MDNVARLYVCYTIVLKEEQYKLSCIHIYRSDCNSESILQLQKLLTDQNVEYSCVANPSWVRSDCPSNGCLLYIDLAKDT